MLIHNFYLSLGPPWNEGSRGIIPCSPLLSGSVPTQTSREIVPPTLYSLLLSKLHDTHPGINRMKSLARSYVWWPGINKEIESIVAQCQICQENRSALHQTVTHPWECPRSPWIRVHVDHAGPFMNHYFLILVDSCSQWIEDVHMVPSINTEMTVRTLRQIFSILKNLFQIMVQLLQVMNSKNLFKTMVFDTQ